MAFIDLDKMLNHLTGWELEIGIKGERVRVSPSSIASFALIEKVLTGKAEDNQIRAMLEAALSPLVTADVERWELGQLAGAATAIFMHAKGILSKNSNSIVRNVIQAMRPVMEANRTPRAEKTTGSQSSSDAQQQSSAPGIESL